MTPRQEIVTQVWLIVTPEYGTLIPIVDGQGPMEYGADVCYVEAENKRDALKLGVKLMQQRGDAYFQDCDNPFAGVKAFPALRCEHGRGEWEHGDCLDCLEQWKREDAEAMP